MTRQRRSLNTTAMNSFNTLVHHQRPQKKQRLNGIRDVVSVLADIGFYNFQRGEYQAAEECFSQALSNLSIDYIGLLTSKNSTSKRFQRDRQGGETEYDEGMRVYRNLQPISEFNSEEEVIAILFYNVGQTFLERRMYKEAQSFFFRSLEKFSVLGNNNSCCNILNVYMNLHCLGYSHYRTANENQANTFYQRSLGLADSHNLGTFHLAASANCVGVLMFNLPQGRETLSSGGNKADVAMEMFTKSLSLHKASTRPNMIHIATVLNNIGRVHYLRTHYKDAVKVYEEGLKLRMDTLGNKSMDVAATAYNLGQTYYQLGRLDDALLQYHQFLSIMNSHSQPSNSKDIALVYKGIGEIYHDRSDYKMAVHYLQKTLDLQKEVAKQQKQPSTDIAATLNKMGNLWYELKDYRAAMVHYQEGLKTEQATLAPDHPHIIVTTTNIGHIHKQLGEYELALTAYKKVLKLQLEKYGHDNFVLADTMSSIGLMEYHLKHYDESFESYQEALRIRRQHINTDEHPEIASTLNSIGLVLFKQEMFELAKNCFTESLRIRSKLLGKNHRDVAILWYNIATIHFETGEDELAVQMYKETLRVERHTLGKSHPDVSLTLQHLGQVHQQLGYSEQAIQYFQEALDIERKRELPIPRSQARILNLLGNVYLQLGRTESMMECYTEAARIYESNRSLGETLVIGGYNFYGLSKTNPPCASVA